MKVRVPFFAPYELEEIPWRLRSTYVLWQNGDDCRFLMKRRTFYRHRRELLSYGIDIAIRQAPENQTNVVPLIRILEAKPVGIPDWAFDQNLVHHSAKTA